MNPRVGPGIARFAGSLLLVSVVVFGVAASAVSQPPASSGTHHCSAAGGASPLSLDDIDCHGRRLEDSQYAEAIGPDYADTSSGALSATRMYPLGGGLGYRAVVTHPESVVRTADELRAALKAAEDSAPSTVYVDDNADIDMSYCAKTPTPQGCSDPRARPPYCSAFSVVVPDNTTLASGRGRLGSLGAKLFSRTFTRCPMFEVKGEGVRITGLRFRGPDPGIENNDPIHCDGDATAIRVKSDGPARWATEIDNNDLSAWPHVAVHVEHAQGIRVHHNVIQFNRLQEHNGTCGKDDRYGLGYGVAVGPGSVAIEANVFDHNRHDIASNGLPGTFYTAAYNLVLDGAVSHSFDVHGGSDRDDCTNVAGSGFVVHHNTFLQSQHPAVLLRGIPMRWAWVYRNETRHVTQGEAVRQDKPGGNMTVADNAFAVNRFPAWRVSFSGASFWQWQRFDATPMEDVAVGDFNGDGAADVMRADSTGWQWSQSAQNDWLPLRSADQPLSEVVVGDFIGQRSSDIVRASGSEWQVSEGGVSPWRTLFAEAPPLAGSAFGDFDGDGHTDAFFADGREWSVVAGFPSPTTHRYREPFELSELRFGNFIGDAKTDVLRSTGTEWLVWSREAQSWRHLGFSRVPLEQLTFADFDGDGFTDIARNETGRWLVSWNGKSTWQVLNFSSEDLRSRVIADFNGDLRADVLTQHTG